MRAEQVNYTAIQTVLYRCVPVCFLLPAIALPCFVRGILCLVYHHLDPTRHWLSAGIRGFFLWHENDVFLIGILGEWNVFDD